MADVGRDIYSTHDAAKICRVTPMTVIRWIEEGKIPAFKTVGGHRRILRADLEAFCRTRGIPFASGIETAGGRILIVDADPLTRDVVAEAARAVHDDLTIELAADAFSAGMLVARFRPHLVFLDQRIAGLDALELCQRLARDPDTASIAVVILGAAFLPDAERAYRARGARACLGRPLDLLQVDQVVRSTLQLPERVGAGEAESVLIVDGDTGFRRTLVAGLAQHVPGCRVLVCDTAIDAMLAIGDERPDVVVIDMGAGALDVARRLRARLPARAVIATGAADDGMRAQALDAGAAAYLGKPFTIERLLPLLHAKGRLAEGTHPVPAGDPDDADGEPPRRPKQRRR